MHLTDSVQRQGNDGPVDVYVSFQVHETPIIHNIFSYSRLYEATKFNTLIFCYYFFLGTATEVLYVDIFLFVLIKVQRCTCIWCYIYEFGKKTQLDHTGKQTVNTELINSRVSI